MSRILRRPMFRGGRVDSRGTGITSGLSYQKGGRVGYFQDQPGGVVLGKDLIANNIFSGTPQSKDYMDKKDFYKNYKIRSAEDIAEDYEDMMRQKEDDLTMTFGIDDYSGFQNKVAEDLDYYRDPKGGMMKFFQEEKAKDDAARIEAKKYEVELPELINSQTEELPQELTQAQLENIELRKLLEERMSKGTPEEEIEKKKEMFKKAYGSGVADDASTMALSFAGKALKPEATVKSAFSEFFEDESKRPSESKKYKDAATTAAINAYLTGQSSFQKFEDQMKMMRAGVDYKNLKDQEKVKSYSVTDYVMSDNKNSEGKAIEIGTRKVMENKGIPGKINKISGEENTDELLVEENVNKVFYDTDNKEVFLVTIVDGQVVKDYNDWYR
jgi:hypothetical protein